MSRARDIASLITTPKFSSDVGIGDSASDPLHIHDTDPAIRFEDTSSGISGHSRIFTDNNNAITLDADTGSNRGSTSIMFKVDGTDRMRIDSSGNVGIGVTSPSAGLHIDNPNDSQITAILDTDNSAVKIVFRNNTETGNNVQIGADGSNLVALTNASERMRIDSSGNFLVGKTSIGFTSDGFEARANGQVYITDTSDVPLVVRRNSTDDDIVAFFKDDTKVGIIGVGGSSAQPVIGSANTSAGGTAAGLRFDCANNSIQPWNVVSNALADDTIDLGLGNIRFDDIFATNSTINTSDENEKQDIAPMTTAELAVGKRLSTLFKTFRWKSKVTEKAGKARTHSGIVAQEVKAAFEAEGLDATKYALFCSDTWTNDDGKEQTRMGVRYPELLSFIASYNESRFTAIEARLTALEGG